MPFDPTDIRFDLVCGRDPDGRPRGWFRVMVRADALRPLGLHPDQPTSVPVGPSPPDWWHAEAERLASTRPWRSPDSTTSD